MFTRERFSYLSLYRLDVGDGKDLELNECPRSKLRQQCIVYLGPVGGFIYHNFIQFEQ